MSTFILSVQLFRWIFILKEFIYRPDKKENKKAEKIADKALNNVAGGYVFDVGKWAGDASKSCEVIIDADGSVRGRYSSVDEVKKMAKKKGEFEK